MFVVATRISFTALALMCAGCASVGTLSRSDEAIHFQSKNNTHSMNFWRCQFGVVPTGHRGSDFVDGVCGVVDGDILVRKFDRHTSVTSPGLRLNRSDVGAVAAFCDSVLLKQVQVRVPTGTLATIFRPDGGVGMNESAAKTFEQLLRSTGWTIVPADGRLDHAVGPGFNGHGPVVSC